MNYYKSAEDFEKEITDLIVSCLSDKEKEAYEKELAKQKVGKSLDRLDMVLPKGCAKLGFDGSTLIEMKYNVHFDTPFRVFRMLKTNYNPDKYNFVLIYRPNPRISFWGIKPGLRIIPSDNLFSLAYPEGKRVQQPKRKKETKHQGDEERNKSCKEACKKAFAHGNCTLFIGAGVSMSAGLPGWDDLLYRMLEKGHGEREIKREDKVFFKRAFDSSTMVMARYLQILLGSEEELIDNVKSILYPQKKCQETELIRSVVELSHYETKGKRKVKRIITYNYDNSLEKAVSKRDALKPLPFFNDDGILKYKKEELPIYHVHGFIPEGEWNDDYGSGIVLAEDAYHHLYNTQDEWVNDVQKEALSKGLSLFVGMSMNDPNLRRLLEEIKSEGYKGCKHFAFLTEWDFFNNLSFVPKKEIVEKMFHELGVDVIWYKDYNELPKLLRELME